MTQVVWCLPSKHKVLSSHASTGEGEREKERERKRERHIVELTE
jgi:hypothetical protein